MAELFQRDKSTISRHIKNIFTEGELQRDSVVAKFATTASDGKVYNVDYYNLDVIISVGYRVKSKRGTQFRIWATGILKEYMRKGFVLDDDRLKNLGGGGYFKELLDRIRDIRASEKVFYRQVLEIYATSIDYDPKAEISIVFFKKVQNKIHYAIHGQTAAEVIYTRADAEKEFMGLTTFKGNQPTLKEAVVAKNYLSEKDYNDYSGWMCVIDNSTYNNGVDTVLSDGKDHTLTLDFSMMMGLDLGFDSYVKAADGTWVPVSGWN